MYESQRKAREAEAAEVLALQELNRQRYQEMHAVSMAVHEKNMTGDKAITATWEGNKVHKHNRMVKNLHYEMAVQTFRDLKKKKENFEHAHEQREDIEGFEQNMRRNGFGGDGGDDTKLDVTYEDAGLYLKRLEDMLDRKKPSDAEVGDFTLRLKKRTKELRQARIEKIRRKRRMMLSQMANGASTDDTEEALRIEMAKAELEASSADALRQTKAASKQERDAEIAVRVREAKERVSSEAEEKLRIFCEEQRMIADAYDRSSLMLTVAAARAERMAQKHTKNIKICSLLVQDLISEVVEKSEGLHLDVIPGSVKTSRAGSHLNANPNLHNMLSNFVHNKLSDEMAECDGPPAVHLHEIMDLDLWPSAVAMLSNAGLFSGHSDSEPSAKCRREVEVSIGDSLRNFVDELLDRFASAAEPTGAVKEKGSDNTMTIQPTHEEIEYLLSPKGESEDSAHHRCILVFGHFSNPFLPERRWREAIGWLNNSACVSLWDAARVLESMRQIAAAEVITTFPVPAIMNLFFEKIDFASDVDGTAILSSIDLPTQAKSVINELNVYYNRIMAYFKDVVQAGKESEAPFDDSTINIMILQVLWLRKSLYQLLTKTAGVVSVSAKTAIAVLWCSRASTSPSFLTDTAKCASWILRGCTRGDIPESESIVQKLIAAEAEREKFIVLPPGTKAPKAAPAKAKAAPKKGAVEEVPYDPAPALSAMVVCSDFSSEDAVVDADQRLSNEMALLQNYCKSVTVTKKSISNEDINAAAALDPAVQVFGLMKEDGELEIPSVDALICKSDFEYLETISALLLNCCGYKFENSNQNDTEIATSIGRVMALVEHRRSRLGLVDRVWINHTSGKHVMRVSDVIEAAEQLYFMKKTAIELICPLMMSCMISCVSTRRILHKKTADVVKLLKASDLSFDSLCSEFVRANKNQPGSSTLKQLVSDLGDVIDKRHFEWTHEAAAAVATAEHVLTERVGLVQEDVSYCTARIVSKLLHCAENASKAIAAIFENAGYSALPWSAVEYLSRYNIRSRGGALRMAFDRRRDVIRANAAELSGSGARGPAFAAEADNAESLWRDFAGLDLPSAPTAMESTVDIEGASTESDRNLHDQDANMHLSILQDLHFELSGTAICLQSFLTETSSLLVDSFDEMRAAVEGFIRTRSSYEHAALRSWRAAMEAKHGPTPRTLSLPSDSFQSALSSEEAADGVPAMSSVGSVDLGEMTLNPTQMRDVSKQLSACLSESSLRGVRSDVSMHLSELLILASSRLSNRGLSLPIAWGAVDRVRALVESACFELLRDREGGSNSEQVPSVADAAKRVVVRLVLGTVAPPPSVGFIKDVIEVACSVSMSAEAGDVSFPIAVFVSAVANHSKLKVGWWPVAPVDQVTVFEVHPHFHSQGSKTALNRSALPSASLFQSSVGATNSSSTVGMNHQLRSTTSRTHRSGDAATPTNEGALLLEALAHACMDGAGTVRLSDVVQALCFVPRTTIDTISPLQAALLRSYDRVADAPHPEHPDERASHLPDSHTTQSLFCRPDLTRWLSAASALQSGAAGVGEDSSSSPSSSSLVRREAALQMEGAPISIETLGRLWPAVGSPASSSLRWSFVKEESDKPSPQDAEADSATQPSVRLRRDSQLARVSFSFVAESLSEKMPGGEFFI